MLAFLVMLPTARLDIYTMLPASLPTSTEVHQRTAVPDSLWFLLGLVHSIMADGDNGYSTAVFWFEVFHHLSHYMLSSYTSLYS